MKRAAVTLPEQLLVNGEPIDLTRYRAFHAGRFDLTLRTVRALGGGRVIELGGHPWAMTTLLLEEPYIDLVATVSAEEISPSPDELMVTSKSYAIAAPGRAPRQVV